MTKCPLLQEPERSAESQKAENRQPTDNSHQVLVASNRDYSKVKNIVEGRGAKLTFQDDRIS